MFSFSTLPCFDEGFLLFPLSTIRAFYDVWILVQPYKQATFVCSVLLLINWWNDDVLAWVWHVSAGLLVCLMMFCSRLPWELLILAYLYLVNLVWESFSLCGFIWQWFFWIYYLNGSSHPLIYILVITPLKICSIWRWQMIN